MSLLVDADQVLAFRLAAHGLAGERERTPAQVASSWALQDSPPGAAALALNARVPQLAPGALDDALAARELVAVPNPRTALAILPADEVYDYLDAFAPPDEQAVKAILAGVMRGIELDPLDAQQHSVAAVSEALDGRVLSRDELHEELRGLLPAELLPWCPACKSHHARRGVLSVAALAGRLCHAGREGRQAAFARTDQWVARATTARKGPGPFLARRYLRLYGPSKPADLAAWAGIAPSHARELWTAIDDELVEVKVDERPRAWMLADDADSLASAPPATGARLLGPGDPLLQARDRELLIADEHARKRLFGAIGNPGLALVDGRPVALWRPRKQGTRLVVSVEPVQGTLTRTARDAIAAEAQRVAALRGTASAEIDYSPS